MGGSSTERGKKGISETVTIDPRVIIKVYVSVNCMKKKKKRSAVKVINNFVDLATCEDVPTLVQGGPLKLHSSYDLVHVKFWLSQ